MPDCYRCDLKYGPVCLTLPSNTYAKTDTSCLLVKYGRTDIGDFAYCEKDKDKFYPGSMYGALGWSAY